MADLGCVYRNSDTQRYEIFANLTTKAKVWGTPGSSSLITTNIVVSRLVTKAVFGPLRTELDKWTEDTHAVIKRMEAVYKLKGTMGDRCFNFNVKE